jgi:hypothetical protein
MQKENDDTQTEKEIERDKSKKRDTRDLQERK